MLDELRVRAKNAGLTDSIRINQSGCMSQCGYGPMVVVYPENIWYGAVRAEDVEELFLSHLVGGMPVERLRYRPQGPGKQICPKGREPIPPQPEPSTPQP